jgi:sporulation protein YlmC with PRC-barrel domain
MTKLRVSTMALMAALSLPVAAIAQTNEQVVPPAQENQAQPADPNAADQDNTMKQDVQKADKADAVQIPDGLIRLQDENTFLASDLTGATVYSPKDEAIGDVNDVIVSRDGKVDGIVVGVGGFLGIGEKDVAIEMSKIKMAETENGIKLVLDTTKEELAAAPEFKSKEDMQAEINATQPSTSQGLMVPDQQPAQQQPAQGTDQNQTQQ